MDSIYSQMILITFQKLMKLLSQRVFVILGEISFSLYLIHQPVVRLFVLLGDKFFKINLITQYCIYWVLILFASYCLWVIIEMPCQKALKNLYKFQFSYRKTIQSSIR